MGRRAKNKQGPPPPLAEPKPKRENKAPAQKVASKAPSKEAAPPAGAPAKRAKQAVRAEDAKRAAVAKPTARQAAPKKAAPQAAQKPSKAAAPSSQKPSKEAPKSKAKAAKHPDTFASEDDLEDAMEWGGGDRDEFDLEGSEEEEDEEDEEDEDEDEDEEDEEDEEDDDEEEEEDEEEDEDDEDDEEKEEQRAAAPPKNAKALASKREAKDAQAEDYSVDNVLASLGLPKGKQLTERQKRKLRAEAERLEELLKSHGYSVDEVEEDDDEASGDEASDDSKEAHTQGDDVQEAGLAGLEDAEEDVEEDLPDDEFGSDDVQGSDIPSDEIDDDDLNAEGLEDEDDLEGSDDDLDEEGESGFLLPTVEEEEAEERAPLDLQLVQMRIREVGKILSDLPRLGEPGKSRADYMDRLSKDVQRYYGYNEYLANLFLELFAPEEAIEFFEANEVPRPVTIRVNTLKTRRRDLAQKLINRGVSLEPVGAWSKVGLQIFESPVPIGATPEYLVGDYMLQAVSSFLPCIALAPQPGERVLDMASAPGGKVTYLSALMQNTGCVFANDSNKARIKSLTANIHRMGCRNVVVCNYDGRQFPKVMGGFDRVMLDSPCSGTGVVSKDPSVKTNKSKRDFILLTQLQKQLILCAIDSVSPKSETGGYVVYSTCSVTVEENEEVVEYALRKRPNVRIVPTGIEFGRDGFKSFRGKKFDEKMPLCRRIFPHAHNLDGFFVCKLKVELPNKGAKRRQEAEAAAVDAAAEADAAPAPAKRARKAEASAAPEASVFDAEEDDAILARARARDAKRRRA
ncbi:25S rRNA (cytosine(2870)-C(5))-methyltransferase [Malassezia brasiliensis]|uniref:Nucleolar protein 2 n=1 Tax=Malassezia brasiliensis TaxID=1821822 RepID=A0AAF0IUE2_9BASI|nr:25S rRNA (cytosine(2870)-C(5))-methyltransferase [Malassezia brasiliensis]